MRDTDRSKLYPPFARIITEKFEPALRVKGIPAYEFEALRSWEQQEIYYAQGRTTPGPIITNARPGDSYHQYGIAEDWVMKTMLDGPKPSLTWSWDIKVDRNKDGFNDWKQMADIAVACGLDAAYYWKTSPECPHVQMHLNHMLKLSELKELYRLGGLPRVWETFDRLLAEAA